VREYGTGVCVCLVTAVTKNRNVGCENMALVCVCVCLFTAVTKNRNVGCENMALLCVLGYCSDEKQKCGVREYGTGVCAWLLQ